MKKFITISILSFFLLTLVSVVVSEAAATASFNVSMGVGSTNKTEVTKLQNFLINQGLLKATPNGNFGPQTKKAVYAFQVNQNIKNPNGYVGPMTHAAINKIVESGATVAMNPSTVSIKSITSTGNNLGASALMSNSKTIRWETSNYPSNIGVNINLLKKTSDTPVTFSLIKTIVKDTVNDGEEKWIPKTEEINNNTYVEVTCSSSYQFTQGCTLVNTSPLKVQ